MVNRKPAHGLMSIINSSRPRWAFSLIALAVVLLIVDWLTKELAVRHMAFGEAIGLTSFLRFVHIHNSGAAFGMLANQGQWAQWFLTLTGLLVCVWIGLLCLCVVYFLGCVDWISAIRKAIV